MHARGKPRSASGFTLVELMVTLALFSILVMLSVPSFTQWVRNSQIRSVAEHFQTGLRLARDRAPQLNRSVVFSTTNATPAIGVVAVANGLNWGVQSIALPVETNNPPLHPQFIEVGNYASGVNGITVTGPAAVCFNALQKMAAVAVTGVGAPCVVAPSTYIISRTGAVAGRDRPLHVTVSIGGEIRMCDPARFLAAGQPDGC